MDRYIKFLPLELLPTSWTEDELDLLEGTSLAPATDAKLNSLHREYDHFCSATRDIDWCQKYWWDEADGLLSFDDWKQVDAFYRSRALEFPGIGDAMVPVIDMANHASGQDTAALYESDEAGNALLLLRAGKLLQEKDEVTITYGDEKGACEMVFSYGFLEEGLSGARDIFLDLDVPDDDPLRQGKKMVSSSAPGVRLYEADNDLRWESDYVWLVCVNEEDGLRLELAQTATGEHELQQFWRDTPMKSNAQFAEQLRQDWRLELFQLRAVSILQSRVEQQLKILYGNDEAIVSKSKSKHVRARPRSLALSLRELESEMLERFYEHFEKEVSVLRHRKHRRLLMMKRRRIDLQHLTLSSRTYRRCKTRMKMISREENDASRSLKGSRYPRALMVLFGLGQ